MDQYGKLIDASNADRYGIKRLIFIFNKIFKNSINYTSSNYDYHAFIRLLFIQRKIDEEIHVINIRSIEKYFFLYLRILNEFHLQSILFYGLTTMLYNYP